VRITDRFISEHRVFLEQLDMLRALLDDGQPVGATAAALRTLAAPLGRHAKEEEEILFPALAARIGEDGPISILRAEHRSIEEQIEGIAAGSARAEVARMFDAFAATLRDHIAKEDDVLFPIAERVLGEEELAALDEPAAAVAAG